MRVKVEKVVIGVYEYDSIFVNIDGKDIEIVFKKEDRVFQHEGKEIELVNDKGIYRIKSVVVSKKND